jgi:hypothetical protein
MQRTVVLMQSSEEVRRHLVFALSDIGAGKQLVSYASLFGVAWNELAACYVEDSPALAGACVQEYGASHGNKSGRLGSSAGEPVPF